jgi:hypothetical protein
MAQDAHASDEEVATDDTPLPSADEQASEVERSGSTPDEDEDDDDVSELLPQELTEHPSVKAMSRKLKKLNRQNRRLRDEAGRFRGIDVDELTHKARISDQLAKTLAARPDLAKALLDDKALPAAAEEFDPEKLPFDVSDASGKFFADFYKKFLALEKQNERLATQLSEMTTKEVQTARRSDAVRWKQAVDVAASQVPEGYRDMFSDAMYLAFEKAQEKGITIDPQLVISHYLKKAKASRSTIERATAAAQQRLAEGNSATPRGLAPRGQPTSARNPKELLADVHRRLRSRFGS